IHVVAHGDEPVVRLQVGQGQNGVQGGQTAVDVADRQGAHGQSPRKAQAVSAASRALATISSAVARRVSPPVISANGASRCGVTAGPLTPAALAIASARASAWANSSG